VIQQLKIDVVEESTRLKGNEIMGPNTPIESNRRSEEKISTGLKHEPVNRPLPMGHDIADEDLFKRAPKHGDCDICCLELPNESLEQWRVYQPCCGKVMCIGCLLRVQQSGDFVCPFCRSPGSKGFITKLQKRVSLGDSEAMYNLGIEYCRGRCCKRDMRKAMELFHQAAELGSVTSHGLLGTLYHSGEDGVKCSEEKASYHTLQAAIGGHNSCRHDVAVTDMKNGYTDRAMKHFLIAASDGYAPSLQIVTQSYTKNLVSKDDFAKALRAYHASLDAILSRERAAGIDHLNALKAFL
jgi:hypothetical protein